MSKGLNFIPTPKPPDPEILNSALIKFYRNLRITNHFKPSRYAYPKQRHPFKPTSKWSPPKTNRVLEKYINLTSKETPPLRHKLRKNLSPQEYVALHTLKKNKDIIINKADKGGKIVIVDTDRYLREGLQHLNDKDIYSQLGGDPTHKLVAHITKVVNDIYNRGYIDLHTRNYLLPPRDTKTQRLYFLRKIHKNPHKIRPIVSGCAGATEHISAFLDMLLQPLAQATPAYIKDSKHIINILEETTLPSKAILCTIDVSSLYTNIPQDEGTQTCIDSILEANNTTLPKHFLKLLFDIILKGNIFRFNDTIYSQKRGTAMGTKMAPSFANLFMHKIETSFIQSQPIKPTLWKRYIDDILCIWTGTELQLHQFLEKLNIHHTTIKFTWDISVDKVIFLDLEIFKGARFKKTGHLDIATHFKQTNSFQYLHFATSHPKSTLKGLIKGETVRYIRSNTSEQKYNSTLHQFKTRLMCRGYPKYFINQSLQDIHYHNRKQYLKEKSTLLHPGSSPPSPPPPRLVIPFSPHYKSVKSLLLKHWQLISSDARLSGVFVKQPQVCYKKNLSISNTLVRASLSTTEIQSSQDITPLQPYHSPQPTNKCVYPQCQVCPKLLEQSYIYSSDNASCYKIQEGIKCYHKNIVYCIKCHRCNKMYVGHTEKNLRLRLKHHRKSTLERTKQKWPLYRHFNKPGHNFERDHRIVALENPTAINLLCTERKWITRLKTLHPLGLNWSL